MTRHALVAQPGHVTPGALWFLRRVVYPIVRVLSRPSLDGIANLPPPGQPFLLVGNHPSSIGTFEFLSFMALYARAFPAAEVPPLAAFILAASFTWWPLSWIAPAVGAIPSTYAAAEDALAKGVPICIFPGGDREAFRPFWRQDSADFGGRKGFLRITHKAWVPIVPMGIRGVSAPMLFSSSRVLAVLAVWPWLVGLKRWAVGVLGVLVAALILWRVPLAWPWRALLAWAWLASPFAIASWFPATVKIRIGRPLSPDALFGSRESQDDTHLDKALSTVESAITDLIRT